MNFTATLREILPLQEGQGANGPWKKQDIIVETHEQFPKKVCISIWGDRLQGVELVIGQPYTIDINLESREYNGKWYTDVKAWRIATMVGGQTPPTNPAGPKDLPTDLQEGNDDDFPF